MINIIRMDLYRLIKSRSFYAIMLIFAFIMFISICYINKKINIAMEYGGSVSFNRTLMNANGGYSILGINLFANPLIKEKVTVLEEASVILSSAVVMLLSGVFTVLFVGEDYSSNYIRNIAGCVKRRRYIIYSKIIVMSLFVIIEFIILLLAAELGSILYLKNFSYELPIEQLKCIGLQFLLYIAYSIIIILLSTILKNTAISMMLQIGLSFGIINLVIAIISLYIVRISHFVEFCYLDDYSVICNIQVLTTNSFSEIFQRALFIAVAATLSYGGIAAIVMEKRDIK